MKERQKKRKNEETLKEKREETKLSMKVEKLLK